MSAHPHSEEWEKFAEEFSDGEDKTEEWDSLKDAPFNEDGQSEVQESSDVASPVEASETTEINSISDYMNAHNYGPDDFSTYSQDPQWRQLMRQEYPDYELPELTQENASSQLTQYMNDHNYGQDDYAEYSQDPTWRELHSAAYPDDELPPLNNVDDVGENIAETGDSLETPIETQEYGEYKKGFFSRNNIEKDYQSFCDADSADLSEKDISALEHYTGNGYSEINRSLYDPEFKPFDEQEGERLRDEINTLTDCIDDKELARNSELYRGISSIEDIVGDDVNNLTPEQIIEKYTGAEYRNPAFTSASCRKDVADSFADSSWGDNSGLLTIHAPKGTKAMCVGNVGTYGTSEGEVLMQRGTIYKIDNMSYNNGRYDVVMTAKGNAR